MGWNHVGYASGVENTVEVAHTGIGVNRAPLPVAVAERMTASGKYEEEKKTCQYEADCSADRHFLNIPLKICLNNRLQYAYF